ncbi:MAG: DUF456 domain-containing protein [Siphonobacter sp.]
MEIILLILGVAALLTGLAGAILPLPGPPLSYVGLWLLYGSGYVTFSIPVLVVIGLITLAVVILDYYIPVWGVKKFGGTAYGAWGSTIGLVIGFFVPIPGGIFLGAFLGAFVGELVRGMASGLALKAALGSFLGFLIGIAGKVILCLAMIGYAIMSLVA